MDKGTSAAGADAGERPPSIQRGRRRSPGDSGPVWGTCGASQAGGGLAWLAGMAIGWGCGGWACGAGWACLLLAVAARQAGGVAVAGLLAWPAGCGGSLVSSGRLTSSGKGLTPGIGAAQWNWPALRSWRCLRLLWRLGAAGGGQEGPNRPGALQRRSAVLFRSIAHSILTAGDRG